MQMMDVDENGTSSNSARPHTGSVSRNKESSTSENAFVLTTCSRNKVEFPKQHTSTSNNEETTDESETEERLLVIYCRSGKLGAAYYTLQTGELFVLDEIVDRPPEHQILCSLFRQVRPALLLLDGKAPAGCVSVTKSLVFADSSADEDAHCKLQFISSKEYSTKYEF
ncbi:PREDICTED: uncharacterized protein LOC106124221 [Papilio xuthus]|uniref:Uncharacterized protein LOC106124221 n=1 Tax=Papilio xuthus TaxID=66420 RepID=A0AAJ7EG45_PAPXU|nr:PREDICTED: uncharacterized protein LOC106124221 [Papilio xuthus]